MSQTIIPKRQGYAELGRYLGPRVSCLEASFPLRTQPRNVYHVRVCPINLDDRHEAPPLAIECH